MNRIFYLFPLLLLLLTCSTNIEPPKKFWLGKEVHTNNIVPVLSNYHMFDSTGTKVGSMVFAMEYLDGQLIAIDTSQFDDGSVYETATFVMDTSDFTLKSSDISMSIGPTNLKISLDQQDKRIKGVYQISRDTAIRSQEIDSVYSHDIFRSELYMLLPTLDFRENDSLSLRVLVPTSMGVSVAAITYVGEEEIEVPAGRFSCDVIWLKADGGMPDNKVWIRKTVPRRIVKFFVPDISLDIELVSNKKL